MDTIQELHTDFNLALPDEKREKLLQIIQDATSTILSIWEELKESIIAVISTLSSFWDSLRYFLDKLHKTKWLKASSKHKHLALYSKRKRIRQKIFETHI